MKDYALKPHFLEDEIVVLGINGINRIKEKSGIDGHISGGMAVSSYLSKEKHRATIDLDFNLLWNGGKTEYLKLIEPLNNEFSNKNYSVSYQKRRMTHDLFVKSKNTSLLIQHQRRSKINFEKNKHSLEREISNQRIVFKKNLSYSVLSPEDIILHKINRSLKFSEQYKVFIPKIKSLSKFKNLIDNMRKQVIFLGDSVYPKDVAKLRIFYDLYDIKELANNVGLNKNYFHEVAKDWINEKASLQDFNKFLNNLEIELI